MWHFSFSKSLTKIEKIKECALRILYEDYTSDYNQLLNKSSKVSMEAKGLRNWKYLKTEYMQKVFIYL